ncbi:unnamed protein product [Arabis nemorensis]|uniref:Uncharacterized protein n=1 Tax=Arabis nemorensis TaxID=586526 RepID=A0A565CS92_9BRAS|nr:unnamed protein product [Arabis nemorensis]
MSSLSLIVYAKQSPGTEREWKRCWPFLTGFAVTGVLITKFTAGLTGLIITFILSFVLNQIGDRKTLRIPSLSNNTGDGIA